MDGTLEPGTKVYMVAMADTSSGKIVIECTVILHNEAGVLVQQEYWDEQRVALVDRHDVHTERPMEQ